MTLRARLLVGLLVVVAAGMAIAGAITYHEQQRFLLGRVDAELSTAAQNRGLFNFPEVSGSVADQSRGVPLGTFAQLLAGDGTLIHQIDSSGEAPKLTVRAMLAAGSEPFTLRSPHYRVLVLHNVPLVDRNTDQALPPGTLLVAIPIRDVDDALHQLLVLIVLVALAVLAALLVLTWLVVKLGLRPLQEMEVTAGAIAAGDLSQRVEIVDENTEVGRLGLALNEMLHQIESAFAERTASEDRLRRFVADASHELRTPLTSIRGYAELFRRGAADRPEDLKKTMRRIEEEAARMGILVDDLLLLARLDQGRPLEREPVDLTRITADAVDDARAVAPGRPISYTPSGQVVVPGDEPRLRQVLANLLQNANRHTPPQTPVYVSVRIEGTDALIEVRDEGPGMDPEDARRVFERFWRIDPSRARQSGGAGLGLAIVSAIADAHGGRAELETEPGHGATFTVRIPLNAPDRPDTDEPDPTAVAERFTAGPVEPEGTARGYAPVPDIPLADLVETDD